MYIVKNNNRKEIVVKKSRFIASIFYVENEEEVKNNIKNLQKEFYEARHHVYAYIIGSKKKQSDDGEPSGTGGKPILSLLENENMTNCLIVVTRIFGGILLGTGGLAHAYGDAAKLVLENSEKKELIDGVKIDIKFNYEYFAKIKSLITNILNSKIDKIEYGDIIYMQFSIPKEKKDIIYSSINNATNGKIDFVNEIEMNYYI